MTPSASNNSDGLQRGCAPWLVFAVGNRSRGDDALGPVLLEILQRYEHEQCDVEFLLDFQLQIEHALDVRERAGVLFIDAALPGTVDAVSLTSVSADTGVLPTSHALRAEAVLNVAQRLNGSVPPAWQLAIEGECFDLGNDLSEVAQHRLNMAVELARQWLADRRCESNMVVSPGNTENA